VFEDGWTILSANCRRLARAQVLLAPSCASARQQKPTDAHVSGPLPPCMLLLLLLLQDGESFLHINYHATELVTWQSVGLLLADSLEDARSTSVINRLASSKLSNQSQLGSSSNRTGSGVRRGRRLSSAASTAAVPVSRTGIGTVPPAKQYNYVLAATQESLIAHMQQLGGLEGPTPCLIYICSNVTLSKPPVPASGIPVARPMFMVGLVRYNTSIDWYMQVRLGPQADPVDEMQHQ